MPPPIIFVFEESLTSAFTLLTNFSTGRLGVLPLRFAIALFNLLILTPFLLLASPAAPVSAPPPLLYLFIIPPPIFFLGSSFFFILDFKYCTAPTPAAATPKAIFPLVPNALAASTLA